MLQIPVKETHASRAHRPAICLLAIAVLSLWGCNKVEPPAAPAPTTTAPTPTAATGLKLPVSINAVMVSLVDHSARPVWSAANQPPKTDKDWGELEYHAYQNMIAGVMIQLPGTGPNDAAWVAQPEWKAFANELVEEGQAALKAAQAKDATQLEALGNKIVETCEACHAKFKPSLPTGKILLRYP